MTVELLLVDPSHRIPFIMVELPLVPPLHTIPFIMDGSKKIQRDEDDTGAGL